MTASWAHGVSPLHLNSGLGSPLLRLVESEGVLVFGCAGQYFMASGLPGWGPRFSSASRSRSSKVRAPITAPPCGPCRGRGHSQQEGLALPVVTSHKARLASRVFALSGMIVLASPPPRQQGIDICADDAKGLGADADSPKFTALDQPPDGLRVHGEPLGGDLNGDGTSCGATHPSPTDLLAHQGAVSWRRARSWLHLDHAGVGAMLVAIPVVFIDRLLGRDGCLRVAQSKAVQVGGIDQDATAWAEPLGRKQAEGHPSAHGVGGDADDGPDGGRERCRRGPSGVLRGRERETDGIMACASGEAHTGSRPSRSAAVHQQLVLVAYVGDLHRQTLTIADVFLPNRAASDDVPSGLWHQASRPLMPSRPCGWRVGQAGGERRLPATKPAAHNAHVQWPTSRASSSASGSFVTRSAWAMPSSVSSLHYLRHDPRRRLHRCLALG